jgi:hypothetical protein
MQKSRKDAAGSGITVYLKANRAGDVEEAWVDLIGRGRGWTVVRGRTGCACDSGTGTRCEAVASIAEIGDEAHLRAAGAMSQPAKGECQLAVKRSSEQ